MTRKDFELIARTIKGMTGEDFEGLRPVIARRMAEALEQHGGNANFDKARFLKACGCGE